MCSIPEDIVEGSRHHNVQGMGSSTERHGRPYKEERRIFEAGYVGTKWLSTSVAAVVLLLISDLSRCKGWSPLGSPHVERPIF